MRIALTGATASPGDATSANLDSAVAGAVIDAFAGTGQRYLQISSSPGPDFTSVRGGSRPEVGHGRPPGSILGRGR
jgi:hypothetical protein